MAPRAEPGGPLETEPRRHHYLFAHLRLRQLVLADATRFVAAVAEPDFLAVAWRRVADEVPDEHRLPPDGLAARVTGSAGSRVAVVRLPTPAVASECYLLGAREGRAAMLTLELARDLPNDAWTTALGRWDPEGHTLLRFGEPADEDRFTELVAELL